MSSTVQQRLPLVLFRAILRWSNKAEGVPFQLRHTDILKCTGPAVFSNLDAIDTHYNKADVIRDIARQTFKFNKDLQVSRCHSTLIVFYKMYTVFNSRAYHIH